MQQAMLQSIDQASEREAEQRPASRDGTSSQARFVT
jgi:hypothetical protein